MTAEQPTEFTKALTPVKGLLVIDPATSRALPPEGARVRGHAEYWTRRLNDGDVEEVLSPPDDRPSASSTTRQGSKP